MLKLKEGFLLRKVAGQWVILAFGDELDVDSIISLNETGAFLWERLTKGSDVELLTAALLDEYDVNDATARECVEQFVAQLRQYGFLEE